MLIVQENGWIIARTLSMSCAHGKPAFYRVLVESLATLKPDNQANRSASPSPLWKGHSAGKPAVVFPTFIPAS